MTMRLFWIEGQVRVARCRRRAEKHILSHLTRGHNVPIHCRQGIGRAATIASARVAHALKLRVPETPEQSAWLDRFHASVADAKMSQ